MRFNGASGGVVFTVSCRPVHMLDYVQEANTGSEDRAAHVLSLHVFVNIATFAIPANQDGAKSHVLPSSAT